MHTSTMKTVVLSAGERVPAFSLGTWKLGDPVARGKELATLRQAAALKLEIEKRFDPVGLRARLLARRDPPQLTDQLTSSR